MKILFTGGGSGGHFYPLIAVAEEVARLVEEQKLVGIKLYYLAPEPYDRKALFEHDIVFIRASAGKIRRYPSVKNIFDWFRTGWGIIQAIIKLYFIFPDVVFGKGGYASFPALFAARLLGIPVVIHDSDSIPGTVNLWAGRFARRVALSYPEALKYFPAGKAAVTGNPLRREILTPITAGAHEFLNLEKDLPVIFVVGGSQGATKINDAVLTILPKLLEHYQVIHQVGEANYEDCQKRLSTILDGNPHTSRYKLFPYLNDTALRMTAGVSDLIVSRAGSIIFEIANWGIPSIIIPIPESVSHDQKTNAFTYARSGGAIVIEEENLGPAVLLSEINRLMENDKLRTEMAQGAKQFANPDAGRIIAQELLAIILSHENS